VTKDGYIKVLPLTALYYDYRETQENEKYYSLFEMAVLRNDWFDNAQGNNFFRNSDFNTAFFAGWKSFCAETFFFEGSQWETIAKLPSMPVYDMKIYGFKIFLGTGEGLYELPIYSQEYHVIQRTGEVSKKFDARVIGLSARGGEIAVSAGNEGLFHGTIWTKDGSLNVDEEHRYCKKSIRTNWIYSFDLLNYESNSSFSYVSNKVCTSKEQRPFRYAKFDDSPNKRHIEEFGVSIIPMSKFLAKTKINCEDISYSYCSSGKTFFVMRTGQLIYSNTAFDKTSMRLSSRHQNDCTIKQDDIMSVSLMKNATIIEYFDTTVLRMGDICKTLSNESTISVRTFPGSRRFNKMIAITDEHGVSLYTVPIITLPSKQSFYWKEYNGSRSDIRDNRSNE
jgi:hypothetical protein